MVVFNNDGCPRMTLTKAFSKVLTSFSAVTITHFISILLPGSFLTVSIINIQKYRRGGDFFFFFHPLVIFRLSNQNINKNLQKKIEMLYMEANSDSIISVKKIITIEIIMTAKQGANRCGSLRGRVKRDKRIKLIYDPYRT